jgi:hypothetical protein
VIFSRFLRKDRGRRDERTRGRDEGARRRDERAPWMAEISTTWRDTSTREPEPLEVPEFGPYDSAVAPDDGVPRIDFGSLRVPNLPDTPVQLEAAPTGQIVRVHLEHKGSRLQLAAYAAPRTEGIWDEVREEIRTALLRSGAKVVEVESDYGPALAARQGGTGGAPVIESRHLGIDGPRWFVHAVFVGPAANDPSAAPPLWEALRGLVVFRGKEARPVKELLPLRLPPELAARLAEMAARQAAAAQAAAAQAGAAPAALRVQAASPAVSGAAQPSTAPTATSAPAATTTAAEATPDGATAGKATADGVTAEDETVTEAAAEEAEEAAAEEAAAEAAAPTATADTATSETAAPTAEEVEETDEAPVASPSVVTASNGANQVAAPAGQRKSAAAARSNRKASGRSGARRRSR